MADLVHVTGDLDWEGFYVNGDLVAQGHRIVADSYLFEQVVKAVGVNLKKVYYDPEWMESEGQLPWKLSSVKAQS